MNRTLLVVMTAAMVVSCVKEPASIRIKGPRDAVESTKMDPVFTAFERQGETIQLRASGFDKDGVFMGPAKVKWDARDRTVATVNDSGLVTILSSGKTDILASTTELSVPLEAQLPIAVQITKEVRIVSPTPKDDTLSLGQTKKYTAEVVNDRDELIQDAKIHWETSGFAATVVPDGEVEGRAIGEAQLIAESAGKSAKLDLRVVDWAPKKKKRKRARRR